MERTYVNSSNIASIGYDASQMILEVEFNYGTVYQYFDVPQSVYEGLMSADSHGRYFDAYVKKAGYRYERI